MRKRNDESEWSSMVAWLVSTKRVDVVLAAGSQCQCCELENGAPNTPAGTDPGFGPGSTPDTARSLCLIDH